MQQAYWNYEVAEKLEIGRSTLRRWCFEMEKQGYVFLKGEQESRAFTEQDVIVLKMVKQHQSRGKRLEITIKEVLQEHAQAAQHIVSTPRSLEIDNQQEREQFKQNILNEIKQDLLATENRIMERLDQRDHQLMQVLREVQESKRLLAATQKKSFWQRLFGK
ncbi:DUF3967 domain-containing protein [Priestia taiwanensis]|uniref:DUF3967 domain-containing protein n=1 Tax=Priestia taiwanensis TaxID=1347902 RepID=A0A917AXB6_9BACI|nr:DUF3967 domain-containing protein [Priestia taiwanensis]MBM7365302.1 DNA-binding transcriptional MerR regulator [Priestia taiwanensis]GGE86015.1 hypothetical protein GCM10007140_39250 [Priestia taiwanensis]